MSEIDIDNSILGDVLSCSTRAWVKHVQHLRMRPRGGKSEERMKVGSLFHSVFERCLWKWEIWENLAELEKEYHVSFPGGVQEEKYFLLNLLIIAEVWLRHTSTYFRNYILLGTEERLEMPLAPGVTFFGTLDAVVENERGEIWIIESKTTGWLREEMKQYWTHSSQGMGYWALVSYIYGKEPKGIVWNVVQIEKVPPYDGNMQRKCQKHSVKYEECQSLHVTQALIGPIVYRKDQIDHWKQQVKYGVNKFDFLQGTPRKNICSIETEGQFTYPGCGTCEFKDWCWAGRPVELMESMMEEYVWPPVLDA